MSNPIIDQLNAAAEAAAAKLQAAAEAAELEKIRIEYLGTKGLLQALSKEIKTVPPEQRKETGMTFNTVSKAIQQQFDERSAALADTAAADHSGLDLSLPGRRPDTGRMHPVARVMEDCVAIFRRLGFIVAEGPEIETVFHNFDALNAPADHPSRDPSDTFYFDDGRLLRTQTSPVQVRTMLAHKPPVRIVSPGRCFRRDTPDATHSMSFHQIEGLYVDRKVSLGDLKSILLHFAREMFGSGANIRLRPHFFPFTEPSVEADFSCIMCGGKGCRVCKNSGWLEIAGAGMVNPAVFEAVGYDPEQVTGFAFGMGLERLAMLKYRINDIRYFYENDVRFLAQF